MAGEESKKLGEIGEKIASKLLEKIGWKNQSHNISIDCSNVQHKNSSGNQRETHGDDIVYIYNTPFYDNTTIVTHVSVKNKLEGYPNTDTKIKSEFKKYIEELGQIIECAKYDKKINELIDSYAPKKDIKHVGVLLWLHNNKDKIDTSILSILANSRPNIEGNTPYYIIDSGRANFVLKVIADLDKKSKQGNYQFYYPKIGTSTLVNMDRKGSFLPVELIVSDIIPAVITLDKKSFYLYSRDLFNELTCKNIMAYSLDISAGLVDDIYIGFPNYNPATDSRVFEAVKQSFKDRQENIKVFSYNESILDLISE